jgi:glycosyltransferase involved in cell wall biosynthesis
MASRPMDDSYPDARARAPRVSVIVPTRNRVHLLREVLEAMDEQTMDPSLYEVIVMDNRSTDGTAEVVREFAGRVRYTLHYHCMLENRGPAPSRNAGARLARGEILAFTDSDCRPTPSWLEASIAPFTDPTVAFVTGVVRYKPEQRERNGFFTRESGEVLAEHPTYTCSNILYRNSVFAELGGFDETLCMSDLRNRPVECGDTDLAWRVKDRGYENRFVADSVVYHERDVLQPLDWILEPYRLFVVGALVKRHPALRDRLLYGKIFFRPENAAFYLLVVGVALGIFVHPLLLILCVPFCLWGFYILRGNFVGTRTESLLVAVPKTLLQFGFLTARHCFFGAGMLYGSIRYRTLAL